MQRQTILTLLVVLLLVGMLVVAVDPVVANQEWDWAAAARSNE